MNFKEAIENSGYTKVFIAKKIGKTKRTIYYWIDGTSKPSQAEKRELEKLLNKGKKIDW